MKIHDDHDGSFDQPGFVRQRASASDFELRIAQQKIFFCINSYIILNSHSYIIVYITKIAETVDLLLDVSHV